jgi:hypothetical protein
MTSAKYELPPIPPGESPIPLAEVQPEDAGNLKASWLIRRVKRGDGPPCFRPPGAQRWMTYPTWTRQWAVGLVPSGPPKVTPPSLRRPHKWRKRVRELEPA